MPIETIPTGESHPGRSGPTTVASDGGRAGRPRLDDARVDHDALRSMRLGHDPNLQFGILDSILSRTLSRRRPGGPSVSCVPSSIHPPGESGLGRTIAPAVPVRGARGLGPAGRRMLIRLDPCERRRCGRAGQSTGRKPTHCGSDEPAGKTEMDIRSVFLLVTPIGGSRPLRQGDADRAVVGAGSRRRSVGSDRAGPDRSGDGSAPRL
jgi:hypothetical protein